MKYRIHFVLNDGTEDSLDLSGETVEEIRDKANAELAKRGGVTDAYSEELK